MFRSGPTLYEWMTVSEIGWFTAGFYGSGFQKHYLELVTGYKLPPKQKIKSLSKGMRAKVSLALAMAHEPELLILDEPTSGLDTLVRREFLERMVDIAAAGRTVLLSSHQIGEVERVADIVAIIRGGKLLLVERLEDLKDQTRELSITLADEGQTLPPVAGRVLWQRRQRTQWQLMVRGIDEAALNALASNRRSANSSCARRRWKKSSSPTCNRPTRANRRSNPNRRSLCHDQHRILASCLEGISRQPRVLVVAGRAGNDRRGPDGDGASSFVICRDDVPRFCTGRAGSFCRRERGNVVRHGAAAWARSRSRSRTPRGHGAPTCAPTPRSPTWTPVAATRPAEVTWTDEAGVAHSAGARFVLAACAPAVLDGLLGGGPTGPAPEGSQLKLNMVLRRLPRLRDAGVTPEDAFAGTFHVHESYSQLQAAYKEAAAGWIPWIPPAEAYCHSLTDPSVLPPELAASGAQTLTVFALHMPARLFHEPEGQAARRGGDAAVAELGAGRTDRGVPDAGCRRAPVP